MTGPAFPRPVPGSNAIGSFVIGVSAIGTMSAFDVWTTVISQYANSPRITELIENFGQCVDPTANLDEFFDAIFNVDTAVGYGLDVWGRIVGVNRTLPIADIAYFGFEEAGTSASPFNTAPFYSGGALIDNFSLTDDAFRLLIFCKALANISNGSIQSINQILMKLFPLRGNCYCTDDGAMTMTYTFKFLLTAVEFAIIAESGVLPKPTGVSVSVVQS